MTLEQGALAALSAVTSLLIYVCGLLWQQFKSLQMQALAQQKTIIELTLEVGENRGLIKAYRMCRTDGCPFSSQQETQKLKP